MATFQLQSKFLPVSGNVSVGSPTLGSQAGYYEPGQLERLRSAGIGGLPQDSSPAGMTASVSPEANRQPSRGPNGNAWGWRRRQGLSTWKPGMPWQRGQRPGSNLANVMIGGSQAGPSGMYGQVAQAYQQRPQINPEIMQQLLERRMAERGLGGRGRMGGFQGRPQPQPQPIQDYYPQPMPQPSYQMLPSGGFYAGPQQAMGQQEQPYDLYDMMGNWG